MIGKGQAQLALLVVLESGDGIEPRRTSRRDEAREDRHCQQNERRHGDSREVIGLEIVEQRAHRP
jgi:hypothetical protein